MRPAAFDAIVLAGGAGRRMGDPLGTDKALLEVGGVRLLDRVLAAVGDAERIVVVGPRRPTSRSVLWTIEEPAGSGPAAAIVQGLSLVSAPVVVVIAADVPFAATAVPRLLEALLGGADDAAMLVDEGGRRQPLVAAYRAASLARRTAGQDWSGRSVHSLIEGLKVSSIRALGAESLDCDTPEQLAQARSAAERSSDGAAG
jgi:molybdopterin-guanine dinucleotide biosynthesis protein A